MARALAPAAAAAVTGLWELVLSAPQPPSACHGARRVEVGRCADVLLLAAGLAQVLVGATRALLSELGGACGGQDACAAAKGAASSVSIRMQCGPDAQCCPGLTQFHPHAFRMRADAIAAAGGFLHK